MPEVKTPINEYYRKDGLKYVCITENHTLADIARWLLNNKSEAEEMLWLLQEGLNDSKRNTPDLS